MQSLFFAENKDVIYGLNWDSLAEESGSQNVDTLLELCSKHIVMDSTTTLNAIQTVPKVMCYK